MEKRTLNILVLNSGSSSLKASFYRCGEKPQLLGQVHLEFREIPDGAYPKKLSEVISKLSQNEPIHAIGHRIVHGGAVYRSSVRIDAQVKEKIRSLAELAPLHNLADLQGIEAIEELYPNTPQIAVFDTAFHHTLPQAAYVFPGPYCWLEQKIRRYGFHGISYQYCVRRAKELVPASSKLVVCHLGSGASLAAIRDGQSIDTTMGFTPLDGLMMDTRSGSVDPGLLLHLLKTQSVESLSNKLYRESGLLGLSGESSDMRDILEKTLEGHPRCKLALETYLHRLNACIGSMIAALQGLDTIVFTGGIGENAPAIRRRVCENFSFLGLALDRDLNEKSLSQDTLLSDPYSTVKILVIHTQETLEIARECVLLLS